MHLNRRISVATAFACAQLHEEYGSCFFNWPMARTFLPEVHVEKDQAGRICGAFCSIKNIPALHLHACLRGTAR